MIEAAEVAAILLAAGRSERFGSDKLLAPLAGEPVALHAAKRLAGLDTRWRVAICREASPLAEQFAALGFDVLINPHPAQGLSSSLALGIAYAEANGARAALVALGDMPFVGPAHLSALLAAFDAGKAPVVASAKGDTAMPPALFARAYFGRLREGEGDRGGRVLLAGATLVAADPDELADIDRPEDMR
ncbi:MAG TPA: nucleotidyltransferase family protein [Sphingopyxis sp.]|uniref:nucleotidyltransferase family protein n=1 Tax=Sphingopyxis sp. TaxID=1908224 RepID=UPI002C7FCE36|nr:nucleotidyltransferase family protein [Sphingopyxis sp.]HWW57528.1 nucleotidyltransferase family protein [Sphingopyxis sp.]